MEDIASWLTLKSVPGIGDLLYRRLLDAFGTPEAVLTAPVSALGQVEGISARLTKAIGRTKTPDSVYREIDAMAASRYRFLTFNDPDYPSLLKQIPDPPPVLYAYGGSLTETPAVAVVGSRNATHYGLRTTRQLCRALAGQAVTVVSGMARGIDTAAHQGALQAGGRTIAVLGTGLNTIYPAENRKLFHRIAENGSVLSELALDAGPEAHHFPRRNRIISGLSLGTVVVEAARRSGSLITARLAAEQGREVFAVPGSVQSFKSRGTHHLIQQGAKLVENVGDILEELTGQWPVKAASTDEPEPASRSMADQLQDDEARVYRLLGPYPLHIDDIVNQSGIAAGRLAAILLQLELQGMVSQTPGKMFARR